VNCTGTARERCRKSSRATRTITIQDTIPPVLSGVPTNQAYQCLSDLPPLANVTATDNCDGVIPVTSTYVTNGNCPMVITCTWTADQKSTECGSSTEMSRG